MKHRITFTVNPNARPTDISNDYTFHSAMSRMRECMEKCGMLIPQIRYRVTYSLAPKTGTLTGECPLDTHVFVYPYNPERRQFWDAPIVCQLPQTWVGLRFNRKVTVL